jgi:hypothetical protein
VDRWEKLFDRFVSVDRERRERERLERERADALRSFDTWCATATDRMMQEAHGGIAIRAGELQRQAGCEVEALYPARPPITVPPHGPFMTFLHLSTAWSHVPLYSHRLSGAWPLLHTILVASDGRSPPPSLRNRTLVSLPVAMIVQRGDGSPELHRVAPADPARDGEVMAMDELVYRCFEVLLDGIRRAA